MMASQRPLTFGAELILKNDPQVFRAAWGNRMYRQLETLAREVKAHPADAFVLLEHKHTPPLPGEKREHLKYDVVTIAPINSRLTPIEFDRGLFDARSARPSIIDSVRMLVLGQTFTNFSHAVLDALDRIERGKQVKRLPEPFEMKKLLPSQVKIAPLMPGYAGR